MHTILLTVRGTVVVGFRKARAVGFPTANIALDYSPAIAEGTYLGLAKLANREARIPALVFYGKPHAIPQATEARIEAYLLGEQGDIYGETIELDLISFVRPNQKFKNDEELTNAIQKDFLAAKNYFHV